MDTLQTAFKDLRSFMVDVLAYNGPETVRLNGAVCKQVDDNKTRRFWLMNDGGVSENPDPSGRH